MHNGNDTHELFLQVNPCQRLSRLAPGWQLHTLSRSILVRWHRNLLSLFVTCKTRKLDACLRTKQSAAGGRDRKLVTWRELHVPNRLFRVAENIPALESGTTQELR